MSSTMLVDFLIREKLPLAIVGKYQEYQLGYPQLFHDKASELESHGLKISFREQFQETFSQFQHLRIL